MKMNDKYFELLSAYVDNELSPEDIIRVEEMIASSLEMQKKLEDYKNLKSLTHSVKRISPSPYFETRVVLSRWRAGSMSSFLIKSISLRQIGTWAPDMIERPMTSTASWIAV